MRTIPITKAIFDEEEKSAIVKPLETGWIVQGPNVKKFEQRFANFINSRHAKAVSNCTTALHLGLDALGIGVGDKVVVPSFTYVASANAVTYTGAEVVFCDIDLATFNIDVKRLENLLQKDPAIKAVMPVHLFGLCADMPAIMKLAEQYELFIIEDAACGFDSWLNDQHAGTFGDVGCFSFHPRKAITTGEGGMLVTGQDRLFETVSQLCDHGAAKSDLTRHKEKGGSLLPDFSLRGFNYRMTDFQGALGVCQMAKADRIMAGRRGVAQQYHEALANFKPLILPSEPKGYRHGYQSFVCLFTEGKSIEQLTMDNAIELNQKRNQWMQLLEEKGIATRQGTHAVHALSYYAKRYQLKDDMYPASWMADRLSVTLPVYADMTADEFDYVIDEMQRAYQCVA